VLIRAPGSSEFGSSAIGVLGIVRIGEEVWVAVNNGMEIPDHYEMHAAYLGCESEIPEFSQPKVLQPGDPEFDAHFRLNERLETALAFAQCLRDEGFSEFEDPGTQNPIIFIPRDITPELFRLGLESCWQEDSGTILWDSSLSRYADASLAVLGEFWQQLQTGTG
jgi:hypothetical protein